MTNKIIETIKAKYQKNTLHIIYFMDIIEKQ